MFCKQCSKSLKGRQKAFCSGGCKTSYWQYRNGFQRKKILVDMKGGECNFCGYSKNLAALAFHHLESKDKDFSLGMRTLTNTSWTRILKELDKCILLCNNCHSELHNPRLQIQPPLA